MATMHGKLYAESPIYRGNARKTLFTRDGDGKQKLVSLAGEIQGTAQSLMDAFIGESRNRRNIGLLNRLWQRLYGSPLPNGLITGVDCKLEKESYPHNRFFDLRMGVKLDEDRWSVEANANYKYETLFRNSVFDFSLSVDEKVLEQGENQARLYYALHELREGRFWFGAAKSKGLGRVRLEMEFPFDAPQTPPKIKSDANHLRIGLTFDSTNPIMVGWNWGKVDPAMPSFAAIEGQLLVEAMRDLPSQIRERLSMSLGGPILSPEDWKQRLTKYLPRVTAIWLQARSTEDVETWVIPAQQLTKLSKGKYALAKSVITSVQPFVDQTFPSQEAAEIAISEALGDKANMAKRILNIMKRERHANQELNQKAWLEIARGMGLDASLGDQLAVQIADEAAMTTILSQACEPIMPQLYEQIDQQVDLLQSDAWVDAEISSREEHLRIKQMILQGKITERQWGDQRQVPDGVSATGWSGFINDHRQVRFHHMSHGRNLNKSITNDENFIAFLQSYRENIRQELGQPHHINFRRGGLSNREISRKYGKPYDTIFMRMLSWAPSNRERGMWEIYIPGSTIKGAFRKRASQVLKTLWGETRQTREVIDRLFGKQGQVGLIFFSDAYLSDPLDPKRAWCSMDGVKMNPKTGQPIARAKADYLFAYGNQLAFHLNLDIQDVTERDSEALLVLKHLLQDFQSGDIPLGGEKTSGFGWVKAEISGVTWLTSKTDGVGQQFFGDVTLAQDGIWQKLELGSEPATTILAVARPLNASMEASAEPPRARGGFISHRAFGGYCGMLRVEAEVLTPISISESGEPSRTTILDGEPVNGWDFFSMSPPQASKRDAQKTYALPSKSIKGMLRHIYSIASDSKVESQNVDQLNPVDSLFGWVGKGQNQSIMGRVSFGFGLFDVSKSAWFKAPYPYGQWKFENGKWQQGGGNGAHKQTIDNTWRLFQHAPLAPIVTQLDDFTPDTVQASYFKAILPGSRSHFTIRFWNLTEEEFQRLIWCVELDSNLAHKMGGNRYLGFGSLRLKLLPESFLIDWAARYAGKPETDWQLPIQADKWLNPKVILHNRALRQTLDAKQL
ncbi:MAG: hypothetical protein KJ638_01005 [Chloroflexi bacterium]|nr:hypothetical protein [Chloroflexota bacterium]